MPGRLAASVLVVLLLVGGSVPAATGVLEHSSQGPTQQGSETVEVGAGEQLSTVLQDESETVHSQVRTQLFATQFENATGEQAAALVNARIDRQYRRASQLSAAYDQTADGSTDARTRRYVALTVRANALERQLTRVERRVEAAPASKLDQSAVDTDRIEATRELLDPLTGPGPRDLIDRFRGRTDRNVSISFDDGVSITVTTDDGSQIRSIRRRGDGQQTIEISETAAREAALDALTEEPGSWEVQSTVVRSRLGLFRVEFVQAEGPGSAVATVDASSGQVVRLLVRTSETAESALVVEARRGELAPGETVVVRVAKPPTGVVQNARITAGGETLGTTGRFGRARITIPEDATTLVVTAGADTKRVELEQ
jgi:hypothetical protein